MAKPFSGFEAEDGTRYATEIEAVCRDTQNVITKSFPELKTIASSVRLNDLALALRDYGNMLYDIRCDQIKPPGDPERPPLGSQWPDEVQTAMNEDNLGEPHVFRALPRAQGSAPMPEGCICDPFDYAALGHMQGCPCLAKQVKKLTLGAVDIDHADPSPPPKD